MILIFEGCDRTGKDTQIKIVKNQLSPSPFHVLHYSAVKSEDVRRYSIDTYNEMFKIMNFFYKNKMHLILNRSHIGELVYAPIYRKYDTSFVYEIEKKYYDKNFFDDIFLFVLYDNVNNLMAREDGSSLSEKSEKNIKKEVQLFKKAFKNTLIKNKILINTKNGIEDTNKKIMEFIIKHSGN